MSFLSVLKSIGHVVSYAAPFSPIISAVPVVGTVASTAINAITAVEQTGATGTAKKAAVTSLVNSVHPGLDQTNLNEAIDGIVAGFNLIEQALGKLPAPAATPAPAALTP